LRRQSIDAQYSHTRFFAPLGGSMLSPPNVFASEVSGAQSEAGNDHPEQDIIENHNRLTSIEEYYRGSIGISSISRWKISAE
jgi:hypothetical protein